MKPKFNVDPNLLRIPDIQRKFQEHLGSSVSSSFLHPSATVEDTWQFLKKKVHDSAKEVLERKSSIPPNRECRRAFADVKKFTFWVNRSMNPKWTHKLNEARENLRRKIREYEENEIEFFFQSLQQYPIGERINRSFQYLKRFNKKRCSKVPTSSIRLSDWILDDSDPSLIPELLMQPPEADLPSGPTLRKIQHIWGSLKNEKTLGIDSLMPSFSSTVMPPRLQNCISFYCESGT